MQPVRFENPVSSRVRLAIVSSVASVALLLALAGCGESDTGTAPSASGGSGSNNRSAQLTSTGQPPGQEQPSQQQQSKQSKNSQAKKRMQMSFGPSGQGLQITRLADQTKARVGSSYRYRYEVKNTSKNPLANVVVYEMVRGGLKIEQAQPQPQPVSTQQKQKMTGSGGQSKQSKQAKQSEQAKQAKQGKQGDQAKQSKQAKKAKQGEGGEQRKQAKQGGSQSPQVRKYALGWLGANQSRTIEVKALPSGEGKFETCVYADFQPVQCATVQVVKPELKLQRRIVDGQGDPVKQAYVCDKVFVAYTVANRGEGTLKGVTVKEQLPKGVTTAEGQQQISKDVGELAKGKEKQIEPIALNVQQAGPFQGRAVASAQAAGEGQSSSSKQSAPRAAAMGDGVKFVEPRLELKAQGPQHAYLGQPVTYQFSVSNPSDVPAMNTRAMVQAPDGVRGVSFSSAQDVKRDDDEFDIGKLDPGASRGFQMQFVPRDTGKVQAQISATAKCAANQDQLQQKLATTIEGVPAIQIDLIDDEDPASVGSEVTYRIRVLNEGSAPAKNVNLTGTLPKALKFVSGSGVTKVNSQGQTVNFTKLNQIPAGKTAEWKVTAKAQQGGRAKFKVELNTDAAKKPVSTSEPTNLLGQDAGSQYQSQSGGQQPKDQDQGSGQSQ